MDLSRPVARVTLVGPPQVCWQAQSGPLPRTVRNPYYEHRGCAATAEVASSVVRHSVLYLLSEEVREWRLERVSADGRQVEGHFTTEAVWKLGRRAVSGVI